MHIRYGVVRYKHTNDGMEDNRDKVGLLLQVTLNQSTSQNPGLFRAVYTEFSEFATDVVVVSLLTHGY